MGTPTYGTISSAIQKLRIGTKTVMYLQHTFKKVFRRCFRDRWTSWNITRPQLRSYMFDCCFKTEIVVRGYQREISREISFERDIV